MMVHSKTTPPARRDSGSQRPLERTVERRRSKRMLSGRGRNLALCGVVLSIGSALSGASLSEAQSAPVVTGDARVDKLLSQMTLQEKLTLIHGSQEDSRVYQGQAGYLAGVPRLGIPGLRFADGPPGVLTRHPSSAETATMGVAATFI